MTAAATSVSLVMDWAPDHRCDCSVRGDAPLFFLSPDPVARELPRDPPAPEAALQRPQQRRLARLFGGLAAERRDPMVGDVEVLLLVERIERKPQAEALGQRDLL